MIVLQFFQLLFSATTLQHSQILKVVARSLLWSHYKFVLLALTNKIFCPPQYVIDCRMFGYTLILVARGNKWSKIVDLFLPLQILVLFRNPKDTAVSFFHFHNNAPSVPSYSSWDEFFSEFMNGKGIVIVTECSRKSNRKKKLKTAKWVQWENSCVIISLLMAIPHEKGGSWMPEWGESPEGALLLGI